PRPRSTLFPYTTLSRSGQASADIDLDMRTGGWSALVSLKAIDPAEIPKLPRAAAAELAGRLDGKVRLAGNFMRRQGRIELSRLRSEEHTSELQSPYDLV